ncbi:MAG: Ppx/GppA phosphatase family protein, partial [Candidatus Kapaibacteriota bacterium]
MTAAGIDIGSNTILMVIVEGSAHQIVRVVEDVQSFPRLGQALGYQRYLPEEAVQRSCEVLTQYRTMLQEYPEAPVYAVATAAVREADNRVVVQRRLEAALGSPIHVIDGLRESELTFAGVGSLAESPTSLLIDIGGGSTEFVLGHSAESGAVPQVVQRWSIPIGAVRLSNMALPEEELRSVIRIALREQLPPHLIEDECDMIGVAGTAVAAAMLAGGITSYDAGAI